MRKIITDILLTLGIIGVLLGGAWFAYAHSQHIEYNEIAMGIEATARFTGDWEMASVSRDNADAQLYFRGIAAIIFAVSAALLLSGIFAKFIDKRTAQPATQPDITDELNP
ncbi:MAG: hypothetical protein FWE44_04865 [Defluviitaleaceae bacterium]|nr:hypothetical protein [Defluviitaleaceae bacterium]